MIESGDLATIIADRASGGGREALIAVLQAFIDESCTHEEAPILCAAGYIFERRGAEVFGNRWRSFLEEKELKYFHAADCVRREDSDEIFASLIALIKESVHRGIVRFIERDPLSALTGNPKAQRFTGSGYSLCTLSCMERIGQLASENREQILYFIEDGNEYAGELRHFINLVKNNQTLKRRFAMAGADTYSKSDVIQLQAADLLAWEFGRAYMNAIVPGRTEWRNSLAQLCEIPHHFSGFSEISVFVQAMVNGFYGLETNRKRL